MKITVPGDLSGIRLESVDLRDPGFYGSGDPHPVWKLMRDEAPVHRQRLADGRSFLSVTRYADVSDVLRDYKRFTSRRGTLLSILGEADPAGDKMMAASDPPLHTAMRGPLSAALSHRTLMAQEPAIRGIVRRLLAPAASGEPWDLAAAMAGFPMAFTGRMMGLPEQDWAYLTRLTTMAIAPDDPVAGTAGGRGLAIAHHELFDYFAEQVTRHGPRDDLIGLLREMVVGTQRMRADQVVYNCYSLLLGANVTTPHTAAAAILAFIENPGEYQRIRGGSGISSAVEEVLRWSSPASHFMRYAVAGTQISGVPVKPGDALVAWIGAANRDDRVFADPYRFDVTRSPNRHLAFGLGPHYCVGAALARIALRLFFTELISLVDGFELAGEVEHLSSNFTAGIRRMPIIVRLRDGAAGTLGRAVAGPGPLPADIDLQP